MRARTPDFAGEIDREGVPIHFEVFGSGDMSIVLVPPSPITHSLIWKAQVADLARRHRVITLDGRGSGLSGRPVLAEDHTRAANVADILAVLDAAQVERAMFVTLCTAAWWVLDLITHRPDRATAFVAIEPGVPHIGRRHQHWIDTAPLWDEVIEQPEGWELGTRNAMVTQHRRWVEFFFGEQLVEAHSTKQFEDAVAWATESTGAVLAAAEEGMEIDMPSAEEVEAACRSIDVPTLVIHGDRDVCQHVDRGRAFAELTGGDLVVIEGAGHLTPAREPVAVNRAIRGFAEEIEGGTVNAHTWTRGSNRPKRALYLSSPIGLGHARRDVAIAAELKELEPDLQIDWLAQHPVTTVLEAEGQRIHPASEYLVSESAHIASEAGEHDLHCFQALRRMDEILVANFMVFQEVVEEGLYDVVIGDEAWDVDHFWHENPELKRGSHVWFTDFVGYLPMPSGGEREAYLTSDYNAEMIEHIARYPRIRDAAIFVGNPDDVVPETFGADLPKIRDWTEEHFDFSGYITGFTPPTPSQVEEWRAELGYGDDEQVCIVTVGGSGVGRDLLERVIAAYPLAKERMPALRMIAVAGPRIDPESLPEHPGLEVRGYVDRLYRHLSVCDLAVVQGGLTTTMELTAAKRPFLYFPLRDHFEQNYHVRHRLDQYGAGHYMEFSRSDPETVAAAIVEHSGRPVAYRDVETTGAKRAAELIAELV